ncbi:MAG: 4Fe-4S dicluster domain-containing protein, partial [Spirochaetia bacterium]
ACEISTAAGLPVAHIRHVSIHAPKRLPGSGRGISENEDVVAIATRQIHRGIRAVESIADIETIEIPLNRDVVVLGDSDCARLAAAEVSKFGFRTTVVSGADPTETSGVVGAFEVTVRSGRNGSIQTRVFSCGAIIDAREPVDASMLDAEIRQLDPNDSERIVSLETLEAKVGSLPRIARQRTIAIVLDLKAEETMASTALACRTALAIQRNGVSQVHLLCRHARIAVPEIGDLYDRAREAGVAILKYDTQPTLTGARSSEHAGIEILCFDTVLNAPVSLECDIVGVSRHGLSNQLSDRYVNNLYFSPTHSSVPGYFLAGAATGEHYAPQASAEAIAAAIEVRNLLSPGKLEVELSTATVDEEKCAICLTCIRACPHLAMRIDSEKNIAENIPQSCRRCGICVGVCPARAISLPEYSEEVVFALLD